MMTDLTPPIPGPTLQRRHLSLFAAGFCAGLLFSVASTVAGQERPPQVPVAPVLVSFSTLDMSRLDPSQFGDWDTPAAPAPIPAR